MGRTGRFSGLGWLVGVTGILSFLGLGQRAATRRRAHPKWNDASHMQDVIDQTRAAIARAEAGRGGPDEAMCCGPDGPRSAAPATPCVPRTSRPTQLA